MSSFSDDIAIRPITSADSAEWSRALAAGFLRGPEVSEAEIAHRASYIDQDRAFGAYDAGRCVATFRSFDQQVTAVGGRSVPADAISNVTVTATHRRRGLLSRMMRQDLTDAKERGDVVATLIAAEYPIYGRFGFGPATWRSEWKLDLTRSGLDTRQSPLDGIGGRIDLVEGEDVRKLGPELHERLRRQRHGVIDRNERWWRVATGAVRPEADWKMPYYAVYRSPDGEVEGYASYDFDGTWGDNLQPRNTVSVRDLIAVTPDAERALWRHLFSIDWVTQVKSGGRAPDDLFPDLVPDARAAQLVSHSDWLWVRILDVVRAFEARTYDTEGALVLEVADRAGLAGGRFRLEASADGASCAPTTERADLALDIADLAPLWTGETSAVRLAALGRVREERQGAARSADALLRTSGRAWCPDIF
ncbi:GNAT family N-acetyltransferase [Streptomyces sp. NPDC088789]|uniref:GNAT family N-acetyltransferase n=1 Tax=Streptomyces sp. NPDC088789 TaxID=3365899 RepID=UPI00380991DD